MTPMLRSGSDNGRQYGTKYIIYSLPLASDWGKAEKGVDVKKLPIGIKNTCWKRNIFRETKQHFIAADDYDDHAKMYLVTAAVYIKNKYYSHCGMLHFSAVDDD